MLQSASSSLSIIARRAVGCSHPGPCCIFPGYPQGSCPSPELFKCASKVIGCIDHNANYLSLLNTSINTISLIRQPYTRAISGFFYARNDKISRSIHHNTDCKLTLEECFVKYTRDSRFSNIVVKLLTGADAYADNVETCPLKKDCNNSLELALDNLKYVKAIGVSEMWELSLLLLHLKIPAIPPLFDDFNLVNNRTRRGIRMNNDRIYKPFQTFAKSRYKNELLQQSNFDLAVYKSVVRSMCSDLHVYNLWKYDIVKKYWIEKSPVKTKSCS